MNRAETKSFLDEMVLRYERPTFIESDPISIPHRFTEKEDIEIIGFLVATLAWGQRVTIINNGNRLCELMEHAPHDFIVNLTDGDLDRFDSFVHRTFNGIDCRYFMTALHHIYSAHGGLESVFTSLLSQYPTAEAISAFKQLFFSLPHERRTQKHVADPMKGSTAKRINMYLRWMVRSSEKGVDFGLWKDIPKSRLSLPLDVHTGNVARKLKILRRKQNDWRAVEEVDKVLHKFDAEDPCRYDFALFGLGVHEGF